MFDLVSKYIGAAENGGSAEYRFQKICVNDGNVLLLR